MQTERDDITPRQRRILEFITSTVEARGYPPTVREIGEAVGLTSSSSVHSQLANLERKGYLTRDPTKPRAIELHGRDDPGSRGGRPARQAASIPVVGRIAAGSPVLATENVEEELSVPRSMAPGNDAFGLRVHGDSMVGAGILDGDIVLVEPAEDADDGQIVVALLPGPAEDEATVKRLRKRGATVMLVPENPAMEPFELGEGRVLGRVTGVLRAY